MVKFLLDSGVNVNERCFGNFMCPEDQKASRTDSLDHEWVNLQSFTTYEGLVFFRYYYFMSWKALLFGQWQNCILGTVSWIYISSTWDWISHQSEDSTIKGMILLSIYHIDLIFLVEWCTLAGTALSNLSSTNRLVVQIDFFT